MPFTFSHPAIILPLKYLGPRWFSLTGLVIGSMTPDFEYFLRMRMQGYFGHTLMGIILFDLPLGLLLTFIFHNLVRDSLVDNLPVIIKSRLTIFKDFRWNEFFVRKWLVVAISVMIGAASHILWDSLTHEKGYFVKLFPALAIIVDVGLIQIHIYRIIQHFSTLVGALAIAYAIFSVPPRRDVNTRLSMTYWYVVSGLTIAITLIRILNGLELQPFGHIIVTAISAFLIAITVTPLMINRKEYP